MNVEDAYKVNQHLFFGICSCDDDLQAAVKAKAEGSTRFCMGAAWRGPSQVGPSQFNRVLEMVSKIRGLGMEVCTTLGNQTLNSYNYKAPTLLYRNVDI